jgi:uncharacterized 2Fe-2S/4Fe-4S cluster protein (DUF4445 family)
MCKFNGQEMPLQVGKTLFDHADKLEITVPSSCTHNGTCHECIVEVHEGMDALNERTEPEKFLSGGFRLACMAKVERDEADLSVSTLKRNPKILTHSESVAVELDPMTVHQDDAVYRRGERIDDYRGGIYGLAIDIGTTTVAVQLINLETGEKEQATAFENPQIFGGSNVLNRIDYDNNDDSGHMRKILIGHLNGEIKGMIDRNLIYEVIIAGNPTMRDIFFGLPVNTIGVKPFKSITQHAKEEGKSTTTAVTMSPRDVGIRMNSAGEVYGLPLIACHVGADTSAGVSVSQLCNAEKPSMLIDMGTNTEIVLGNKDRLIAASCPAGPAFEGAGLKCGMPGLEGAIESFRFNGGTPKFGVIGDAEPRGICGSGVVDILAELIRTERADAVGRFKDGITQFDIAPEQNISIDRQDLSLLSQAKAANYVGQQILLRRFGVTWDDLEHIYFSGGFANYMDVKNAQAIGMIPPVDESKVVKVGNTALEGAARVLVNQSTRANLEAVVETIEHIELEREPDFFDAYVDGCMLEPMSPLK